MSIHCFVWFILIFSLCLCLEQWLILPKIEYDLLLHFSLIKTERCCETFFEGPGCFVNKLEKVRDMSKPGVLIYTELLLLDAHPSYTSSYETQWDGEHAVVNLLVQIADMGITNLLICLSRASDKLTRLWNTDSCLQVKLFLQTFAESFWSKTIKILRNGKENFSFLQE